MALTAYRLPVDGENHTQAPLQPMETPAMLCHLEHLSTQVQRGGHPLFSYIAVYARPTRGARLMLVEAKESGREGIACLDDVARAAILALLTYEQTHSRKALALAEGWLAFVDYMQEPGGQFTNFILTPSAKKNRFGRTSRAGGPWWTARALWALAVAWRITGERRYLKRLACARWRRTDDGKISALQTLALLEWYRATPSPTLKRRILQRCDEIVASADSGYFRDLPERSEVALWGYHQLQAVAQAGRLFGRADYLAACKRTVETLIKPVIAAGFYHVYPGERDHQCAYDLSPMIAGLAELYQATGSRAYAELALSCVAWFDGRNPAGRPLYDRQSGRCSDGMANGVASRDCGAESAIEAGFAELVRQRLSVVPR